MEEIRTLLSREPGMKCKCGPLCDLGSNPGPWKNKGGNIVLCYGVTEEYVDTNMINKAELVFTPNKVAEAYKVRVGDFDYSVQVFVGSRKEYLSTHPSFDRLIKRACKKFGTKAVWVHMELRCPKEK
jgi:hypothetical protein